VSVNSPDAGALDLTNGLGVRLDEGEPEGTKTGQHGSNDLVTVTVPV